MPRKPGAAREVVVARYNEPLTWLDKLPAGIARTVYNKGDAIELPGCGVIHLDNTGREAGTYLSHIVRHYHSLAPWTYFVQGDHHNEDDADLIARLGVKYADSTSLTRWYSPSYPGPAITSLDHVEHHGGHEVRYGQVAPINADWCDAANMAAKAVWGSIFSGPMPEPFVFGYAAQWAVPRKRITDRPLQFWRWLLDRVSLVPNSRYAPANTPFNAWAIEMVWGYLFGDAAKYPVHVHWSGRIPIADAKRLGLMPQAGCRSCGGKS